MNWNEMKQFKYIFSRNLFAVTGSVVEEAIALCNSNESKYPGSIPSFSHINIV